MRTLFSLRILLLIKTAQINFSDDAHYSRHYVKICYF